ARRARRRAAPAAEARALRAAAAETERRPGEGRGRARRGAEEEGAAVSWKVLIVAEHDGAKLNVSTAKCVTCALGVAGAEISVAVCAVDAAAVAAPAARPAGLGGTPAAEPPAT